MPEYLAPGVYVEEVSFRSKSIEGVPTSTTGFAGMTRYGPVRYEGGPLSNEPRLVTSFVEFERVYGGLQPLDFSGGGGPSDRVNYMAYAARAFFDNGGKRLYVSRVFEPIDEETDTGVAESVIDTLDSGNAARWLARWPGNAGNVSVSTEVVRSRNLAFTDADGDVQVRRAKAGAVIEVVDTSAAGFNPLTDIPTGTAPLASGNLRVVKMMPNGKQKFIDSSNVETTLAATDLALLVELRVRVESDDSDIADEYGELGTSPLQKRYIGRILEKSDPDDENSKIWFAFQEGLLNTFEPAELMIALQSNGSGRLEGGNDGALPSANALGGKEADPDIIEKKATGLAALGEIEDIAIVAAPDGGGYDTEVESAAVVDELIIHTEKLRYRIAVVDAPKGSSMNEVRAFRGQFDSTRAALYHPWIEVFNGLERHAQGAVPERVLLPPSGFVCGIYARNDITRGVHKAPANEVVRGLTRFESNINTPRQDVLNPEGINALRFFEGRGHRVWGARTMTSDPEWKYVNVRRLFNYMEHSIDRGTQWAVFEPNNYRLWDRIRRTIEDFLFVLWRDGALLGKTPEEAFFVRIDRTTMTQNDIDNGRMIALVGVAPTKPAEFVIFRIGQWTADAGIV